MHLFPSPSPSHAPPHPPPMHYHPSLSTNHTCPPSLSLPLTVFKYTCLKSEWEVLSFSLLVPADILILDTIHPSPWIAQNSSSHHHQRPDPHDQVHILCCATIAISADIITLLHSPVHILAHFPSPGSHLYTVILTQWEQFFTHSAATTTHISQGSHHDMEHAQVHPQGIFWISFSVVSDWQEYTTHQGDLQELLSEVPVDTPHFDRNTSTSIPPLANDSNHTYHPIVMCFTLSSPSSTSLYVAYLPQRRARVPKPIQYTPQSQTFLLPLSKLLLSLPWPD